MSLFLLQDELNNFEHELLFEENFFNMFRLIKQNINALNTFYETLYRYKSITQTHLELKSITARITKKQNFISYLNNKIGGCLSDEIILESLQCIPHIFHKKSKEYRDVQIGISYQALLETAIKSYLEDTGKEKEFSSEIHLNNAQERTIFFQYIGSLNRDCVSWIRSVVEIIEKDISYMEDDEILYQMRVKSATKYNAKARTTTPHKVNIEDDELVTLSIAEYKETDKRKKIEILNKLVRKLAEKNQEVEKMQ